MQILYKSTASSIQYSMSYSQKKRYCKITFLFYLQRTNIVKIFFLAETACPNDVLYMYSIVHGFSWHCPFILQLQVLVTLSLYTAATGTRNTVPLYYSYGFSWHCPFTSATGSCATFDLYCSYGFSWHCLFILQLRVLVTLSLYTAATGSRNTVHLMQLRVLVTLYLYTSATGSHYTVPLYCSYGRSARSAGWSWGPPSAASWPAKWNKNYHPTRQTVIFIKQVKLVKIHHFRIISYTCFYNYNQQLSILSYNFLITKLCHST